MKTLTPVAIDNTIKLLQNNSIVVLNLLIPKGNIQAMREATNCQILSKTPEKVSFNHCAGELYRVKMKVKWGKISKYLKHRINPNVCENVDVYSQMLNLSKWDLSADYEKIIDANKIPLYAFGEPKKRNILGVTNGIYINARGHKISLIGRFDKYVDFKGTKYMRVATS
jgi:hypothetical protein